MGDTDQPKWGQAISKYFICPQRIILSLMLFCAIATAYMMRLNISIAITRMVVKRNFTKSGGGEGAVCPPDPDEKPDDANLGGEYEWPEDLQGMILSSFYIGYIFGSPPGGVLSEKYGGKLMLLIGMAVNIIVTAISPFCIRNFGPYYYCILRILMGFGQSTVFPAMSVLLSHWVPIKERSTLGAMVMSGGQVGAIVANSVSGVILDRFHWSAVFYTFGFISACWWILFLLLCYNDPIEHPFIKAKEKDYLVTEMQSVSRKSKPSKTPWGKIFTNMPVYALLISQFGHDFGFYILATDLPKYMSDVMRFTIKKNGFVSSLPFYTMYMCSVISGFIADCFTRKNIMTLTNTRKFFTVIAAILPSIFLVLASYAGCDRTLVVIYFTLCMGFMGAWYAGQKLTALDLSPNFAGTLAALGTSFGAITGAGVPYFIGVLTPNATLEEWRIVFWIGFIILSASSIFFWIFGSAEVQDFNELE